MPHADEDCPQRCPYLQETARDMGGSEERQERVANMIDGLGKQKAGGDLSARLFLATLGIDLP
jgi:hypothetical protein